MTMYSMFDGASSFNSDVSAWDVSSPNRRLCSMHHPSTAMSSWDTSSVSNMAFMLYEASSFNSRT